MGIPVFLILFWLIIIGLLVWLIIWLLFCCCRDESGAVSEESIDSVESHSTQDSAPETNEESEASSAEADLAERQDKGTEVEFRAASEEEARSLFKKELESGHVLQDPVYGIVYDKAPDDGVDDLKRISGVAQVLEGKLNGIGVYRFKQVAAWTDAACEEFSKLITFKDRIYRDNWIAQAKALHKEKYGESLE